jgi:hypothetical protein
MMVLAHSANMARWAEFYVAPPQRAIALDELENAALLRLRVLRTLVAAPSAERFFRTAQDLPAMAREALALLDADVDLDSVAHYALRLAFCTYVNPCRGLKCHELIGFAF